MTGATRIKQVLETLGGARPLEERVPGPVIGLWWCFLFLVVIAFAGRTAKFVYVDF
jgi:hypothetical protein